MVLSVLPMFFFIQRSFVFGVSQLLPCIGSEYGYVFDLYNVNHYIKALQLRLQEHYAPGERFLAIADR